MTRPRVIAHRGSSARHPDNSWAAFHAAFEEHADAIECDVQATRDGVLVIRHDLAVDGHSVADLSATEFHALTGTLVTLQEVLAWAAAADIGLLVELKDPEAAGAVAAMIGDSAAARQSVLGSFSAPALVAARAARSDIRTSFMMGSVAGPGELVALARACGADGVHLCWESRAPHPHRLLDAGAIARLRQAGLAITLWHEERDDELRALVALAPDAICTNTPAELRRIIDAQQAPANAGHAPPDRVAATDG